jgi:threonine dehydrogenase-like Zn-dependent dehydrogenase
VPARFLCAIEPPLELANEPFYRLAALSDSASAAYWAMARAGLAPNEPCVVIGEGPRAGFLAALARVKGAQPLSVRADMAAAEAIAAADEAQAFGSHRLKIFETTGTTLGQSLALEWVAPGGTVALLDRSPADAIGSGASASMLEDLARKEVTLLGCAAAHPDVLPELCALVVRGELPLAEHVVAFGPDEPIPAEGRCLRILRLDADAARG